MRCMSNNCKMRMRTLQNKEMERSKKKNIANKKNRKINGLAAVLYLSKKRPWTKEKAKKAKLSRQLSQCLIHVHGFALEEDLLCACAIRPITHGIVWSIFR